ncbi:pectin lyase-like protein [Mycena leptocephala]|nr:pectin lyase-like protein [Mycena leptocephala]
MFAISPLFVCAALALLRTTSAVGTPFGLAAGTTGGGSATPSVPSSLAQLTTWLSDSTARVILLESIYDFTSNEGTTTGTICKPWTCSPNPQFAIDANSWCENYEPSAATSTATYYVSGTKPLVVASNKTLLGKGSAGGIKGKGLKITGANNIIIQNIKITDINAEYVWGGDALQIDGGSNIWVDSNYFQHIGRQMVVTGYGAVTKTTFSNNVFNGDSTYSATCNGCHYWTALFTGAGDQITFALNYLYKFRVFFPRSLSLLNSMIPKSGLADEDPMSEYAGFFSNIYEFQLSVAGHAIDPEVGSKILLEGNYFNTVTTPTLAGDGQTYIPTTAAQASACSSLLGRSCITNTLLSSGTLLAGTDTGTLNGFTASTFKSASIMAASAVPSYVQAHAGVGIVN